MNGIRNFGQEGIDFALNYARNNPILEEFILTNTAFVSNRNISRLGGIIKDHPSIYRVFLDGCCGGDMEGHDALCSVMAAGKDKLRFLDFCKNAVSTQGSTL